MIRIDEELETIARARQALDAATCNDELDALLRACDADPAFRTRGDAAKRDQAARGRGGRPGADAPRLPYHELRSSDGYRILVGRGARDNDRLTLHVARGRDLWLHARDFAGSHVVIPRPDTRPVPERTIEEAAQLAAWNSRGRTDSLVEVTLLERKHVSKPRGLPPGRVQLAAGGRTLLVRPDEALVQALFRSANAPPAG